MFCVDELHEGKMSLLPVHERCLPRTRCSVSVFTTKTDGMV